METPLAREDEPAAPGANASPGRHRMSPEREVQQVLARYVRAADARDGAAMSNLFTPDGQVETYYVHAGKPELIFVLSGREAIAHAVSNLMKPHPDRGWSHHTTYDLIIEVDGDRATIDAQFITYNVVGDARPAEGWPAGTLGVQGKITPIESGYYQPSLRQTEDGWKIARHRILMDMPMAIPGA
ncbi:MAG: hypothetical protein AVDCRST_MAG56-6089 [uncultured Cytophagales bacterium]|uniref:SnoaL-like domain-containing protein n=1 Tax=uncultured Cytophagales bacterium TaxID=158755 RepID=A0A6J4KLP8_9SPHI|nr:MAG: hypothetical protein AVDCRST_MAG56-6089 [uncultured Cytophagales bacterium]